MCDTGSPEWRGVRQPLGRRTAGRTARARCLRCRCPVESGAWWCKRCVEEKAAAAPQAGQAADPGLNCGEGGEATEKAAVAPRVGKECLGR